jgi:hypothetical protein
MRNESRTPPTHPDGVAFVPRSAFRIPTSAGPGAAHRHDPARDAARYRTLAALGYRYILTLTDSEITHTPQCAVARIAAFPADPARAGDPAPELLPQGE